MTNTRERLAEVVSKLRKSKDHLLQEVSDLSPTDAMRGTEWSVLDAVRHLAPPVGGYHRYIRRIVEEDNAVFGPYPPPEEIWAREIAAVRKVFDDTILLVLQYHLKGILTFYWFLELKAKYNNILIFFCDLNW